MAPGIIENFKALKKKKRKKHFGQIHLTKDTKCQFMALRNNSGERIIDGLEPIALEVKSMLRIDSTQIKLIY